MDNNIHLESLVSDLLSEHNYFNNPKFVKLIEAFLRYLEDVNKSSFYTNKIIDIRDIDLTDDEFLKTIEYELGPSIPAQNIGDKRLYLKKLKDLYLSRGTVESIETFFKLFYKTLIQIDYPKDHLLIPSSGDFNADIYENDVSVIDDTISGLNVTTYKGYPVDKNIGQTNLDYQYYNYNPDNEIIEELISLNDFVQVTTAGQPYNTIVGDYYYDLTNLNSIIYNILDFNSAECTTLIYDTKEEFNLFDTSNPYVTLQNYPSQNTCHLRITNYYYTVLQNALGYSEPDPSKIYFKIGIASSKFVFRESTIFDDLFDYSANLGKGNKVSEIILRRGQTYTFKPERFPHTLVIYDVDENLYTNGFSNTGIYNVFKVPYNSPDKLILKSTEFPEESINLIITNPINFAFPFSTVNDYLDPINNLKVFYNDNFIPRKIDEYQYWTYEYNYYDKLPNTNVSLSPNYNGNKLELTLNEPINGYNNPKTINIEKTNGIIQTASNNVTYYSFRVDTTYLSAFEDELFVSIKINGVEIPLIKSNAVPAPDPGIDSWWRAHYSGSIFETEIEVSVIETAANLQNISLGDDIPVEIVFFGEIEASFYDKPNTTYTGNYTIYDFLYNTISIGSDNILSINNINLQKDYDYKLKYITVTKPRDENQPLQYYNLNVFKTSDIINAVPGSPTNDEYYEFYIETPFDILDIDHIEKITVNGVIILSETSFASTDPYIDSWFYKNEYYQNRLYFSVLKSNIDPNSTIQLNDSFKIVIDYYSVYGEKINFILNQDDNIIKSINNNLLLQGNQSIQLLKKIPSYNDFKGFLSHNDIVLQDSYKYQLFSYIIKTGVDPSLWRNSFSQLINPAGFIFFTEILLTLYLTKIQDISLILPEIQPGIQEEGGNEYIILIPPQNESPQKFEFAGYVNLETYYGNDEGHYVFTNTNSTIGPKEHLEFLKFSYSNSISTFKNYSILDAINNNIDLNISSEITIS